MGPPRAALGDLGVSKPRDRAGPVRPRSSLPTDLAVSSEPVAEGYVERNRAAWDLEGSAGVRRLTAPGTTSR